MLLTVIEAHDCFCSCLATLPLLCKANALLFTSVSMKSLLVTLVLGR